MKKCKLAAKTVAKLHRLARELEAANGIEVRWYTFIFEGRRLFYFRPRFIKETTVDHWDMCGSLSLHAALMDFYSWFADYAGWGHCMLAPARYTLDRSVYQRQGHHGKKLILAKD